MSIQPAYDESWIKIDIESQTLALMSGRRLVATYPVSTALNGIGEIQGSECTPCGWHRVRLKIGEGCPLETVFVGRRPTGEIFSRELALKKPNHDWILTRIIWLTGLEPGKNRGGQVDTLRRYIYIHGCPDSEPMGVPESHGCVRMRNHDLVELFDGIQNGTRVLIQAGQSR